jgi:hypothetical protein
MPCAACLQLLLLLLLLGHQPARLQLEQLRLCCSLH